MGHSQSQINKNKCDSSALQDTKTPENSSGKNLNLINQKREEISQNTNNFHEQTLDNKDNILALNRSFSTQSFSITNSNELIQDMSSLNRFWNIKKFDQNIETSRAATSQQLASALNVGEYLVELIFGQMVTLKSLQSKITDIYHTETGLTLISWCHCITGSDQSNSSIELEKINWHQLFNDCLNIHIHDVKANKVNWEPSDEWKDTIINL